MKHHRLLFIPLLLMISACKHQNQVQPERRDIVDAVFGSGHIENKDQYAATANMDGYIKKAYVVEGDTVKTGETMFTQDNEVQQTQVGNAITNLQFAKTNRAPRSPQIEQLKLQIIQAQDKLSTDSLNYARYQRLVQTNAVSKSDYDNALLQYQASQSNLDVLKKNLADLMHNLSLSVDNARDQYAIQQQNNNYYNISAKAPGVVLTVVKKVGDYAKKGDEVAEVGAGRTFIKLYIAEDDIQRIKIGQTALISLNSNKDKIYESTITKIYPTFDTTQQAFTVEATFKNVPAEAINGTQLQGNVIIEKKSNALVIPSYYLMDGDYVMLKSNKQKVPVKVGIRTLEWTEILGGIGTNDVLIQPNQQ